MSPPCLTAFMFSDKKLAVTLLEDPLYPFMPLESFLSAFKFLLLCLSFDCLNVMYLGVGLFECVLIGVVELLGCVD